MNVHSVGTSRIKFTMNIKILPAIFVLEGHVCTQVYWQFVLYP